MRVLLVASEMQPWLKTGGLADVVAALPPALAAVDVEAVPLLPGYPAVLQGLDGARLAARLPPLFGADAVRLFEARLTPGGQPAFVLDAPALFDRPGNPYLAPDGTDWADNHRRFAALGWAAAWLATPGADRPAWQPDILHGHDWQAGLAPAFLRWGHVGADPGRVGTVTTIHNLAFQGLFPAEARAELGLPPAAFSPGELEFYGQLSFLKAGIVHADRITTVSPSYAEEIQTPAFGCGFDGILASLSDRLAGIRNGIDTALWNPASDPHLPAPIDPGDGTGKAACRSALQAELGLGEATGPLVAVVSRLTEQKGLDLLLAAVPEIIAAGGQLALLGTGDAALEAGFRAAAQREPDAVAVRLAYDEGLAHRLIAGADIVAVPSRFEPCGLTQMYAQRYGALPLVRRTGGLADTVVDLDEAPDSGTGFVFDPATPSALAAAWRRSASAFAAPARWQAAQQRALAQDFSWTASARAYRDLYRALGAARSPETGDGEAPWR